MVSGLISCDAIGIVVSSGIGLRLRARSRRLDGDDGVGRLGGVELSLGGSGQPQPRRLLGRAYEASLLARHASTPRLGVVL